MTAPGAAKRPSRVWAHRYGAVCPLSADEQAVLGVRYDEEDDAASETFLLRLGPGRAEALDQQAGIARGLAASSSGALFVLDARGVVHVAGRRHKLATPRAMVDAWGGVVLAGDDRLWMFSADGTDVTPGPLIQARRLASSRAGLLVATDDARLFLLAGPEAAAQEIKVHAGGHMAAVAVDDEGRVAAVSGRTVLAVDGSGLRPVASAPFELQCVALHHGHVFVSSRAHGLFYVEDGRVMPKKPSLRAHTLLSRGGQLVAASDLFVVTSGEGSEPLELELLTRDLAPFVRIAESRWPRFLQPEDPVTI